MVDLNNSGCFQINMAHGFRGKKIISISSKVVTMYLVIWSVDDTKEMDLTTNLMPGYFGLSSINVPNFIKLHQRVLWAAKGSHDSENTNSEKS